MLSQPHLGLALRKIPDSWGKVQYRGSELRRDWHLMHRYHPEGSKRGKWTWGQTQDGGKALPGREGNSYYCYYSETSTRQDGLHAQDSTRGERAQPQHCIQ